MPFGIFTGVNNFGQSICFAGALMCQETIDCFAWIFKSFLKMINNHLPKAILTDTISNAIQITFDHNTKHVLSFYKCIKEYDIENFIVKWEEFKINFLNAKAYLDRIDKVKEKWIPCFNRDTFLADMTSTQHEESIEAFESVLE
ncbi:7053_t:CDS:2 [Funneliformis caledonium]|uniref:7053_t:CDS:1 n=1 Tax=Funneliformis caledonium TaxID=1117310 RepID=A0A9N9C685_9GLOM|nr:7053_t:CDS:2 [Funneliformis caledonium]